MTDNKGIPLAEALVAKRLSAPELVMHKILYEMAVDGMKEEVFAHFKAHGYLLDFAIPEKKVAIEVEEGPPRLTYLGMEKGGWQVLRFSSQQLLSANATNSLFEIKSAILEALAPTEGWPTPTPSRDDDEPILPFKKTVVADPKMGLNWLQYSPTSRRTRTKDGIILTICRKESGVWDVRGKTGGGGGDPPSLSFASPWAAERRASSFGGTLFSLERNVPSDQVESAIEKVLVRVRLGIDALRKSGLLDDKVE